MFSKKNKRKITVDEQIYYWSASGTNGGISLFVMTETPSSPKLICGFDYHQDITKWERDGIKCSSATNQFVVTPYIVRQAILYGLSQGWNPLEKGKDINLGYIDDFVDLRLDKNKQNVIGKQKSS